MIFNIGRLSQITELIKTLETGLRNLSFTDNFNSKVVNLTILAGSTEIIDHNLKKAPSSYIIGRKSAAGEIIDGPIWNENQISITNTGINNITLTLIIME